MNRKTSSAASLRLDPMRPQFKELFDRGFGRAASAEPTGAIVAHLVIDDGYEG
jgi:hypothetical protein